MNPRYSDMITERQALGIYLGAPLLLRAHEAAALCGKSERTWRRWDTAGLVPAPMRIGRATLWRPEDLRAWIRAGCPDRVTWQQHCESLVENEPCRRGN